MRLINKCVQQVQIPKQWKVAYIVSIYKKGKKAIRKTIVDLSRIFGKVIKSRFEYQTKDLISEYRVVYGL